MGTFNDPCVKQSQLTDGWERSSGIAHQHTAPVGPWGHHFAFARRLRHSGLELLQRFVTDVAKEVGAFGPATLLQFGLQIFQRSFCKRFPFSRPLKPTWQNHKGSDLPPLPLIAPATRSGSTPKMCSNPGSSSEVF